MGEYLPYDSGESEAVPLKLMLFVGVIAVLGAVFFLIALAIDRKPIDPSIDPTNPAAFEQTDASEQETPDLWVQKKPPPPEIPFSSQPVLLNPLKKPDAKPLFPHDDKSKPAATQP